MNKKETPTNKKYLSGIVVKKSGLKTAKVKVLKLVRNKILKKTYWQSSLYLVHDEQDQSQEGQAVTITPTKKISKNKAWSIVIDLDKNKKK